MSEPRQIARATALMAGNGYILVRVIEHVIQTLPRQSFTGLDRLGLAVLVLIPIAGLVAAYVALLRPPERSVRWELASALGIGVLLVMLLGVTAGWLR